MNREEYERLAKPLAEKAKLAMEIMDYASLSSAVQETAELNLKYIASNEGKIKPGAKVQISEVVEILHVVGGATGVCPRGGIICSVKSASGEIKMVSITP